MNTNHLIKAKAFVIIFIFFIACKVTFVSGYDPIIEQTATQLQKNFNLHFIKLSRTLQDTDPNNQVFSKFQNYYDQMNVDIIILKSRSRYLGKKGAMVQKQINNIDSTLHVFENQHKKGFADSPVDDRHDIRDGINSSFEALIKFQEALKPKK